MSLRHLRWDHVRLIARTWVRHSIRGGAGLVFTFLTLVAGLSIASVFVAPIEGIQKYQKMGEDLGQLGELGKLRKFPGAKMQASDIVTGVIQRVGKPAVKWALDADADQAEYLLEKKPALISAILVGMLFAVPFLVCLGAFNQLAGDIQRKGLRYLLLRTERVNLFIGRFIGTYLFTLLVFGLVIAVLLLYLVFRLDFYAKGDIALWMLQGYLVLALFTLPYVALCAWISAASDSGFLSLALSVLVVGFVPLLVYIGKLGWEPFKYAGYVLPWAFKFELIHPNVGHMLGATAAMLGFTALFLFLGLRGFQTRDL